jgi:uncharacterized protein
VLGSNETQESSLALVFHYADEKGLPLLDLGDLRALLTFLDSEPGEPQFDVADLMRVAGDGRGVISCVELAVVQDKPARSG